MPKKAKPGTAKTRLLTVKVSAAEMAMLDEVATRHKLDRSELVRRAVHVIASKPYLLLEDSDLDAVGRQTSAEFTQGLAHLLQGAMKDALTAFARACEQVDVEEMVSRARDAPSVNRNRPGVRRTR